MPKRSVHILACLVFSTLLALPCSAEEISDPLEPINRGIFWFNDKADIYVLEPVARGYDFVTPQPVQNSFSNFFDNLRFPVNLVSDLIQFKFGQAATHTGRFLINSTFGLAGFFDPAKELGLNKHYEDLGVALGYHGVPPGPYIVIPLLGPSNLRDAVGRIGQAFLDPTYYLETYGVYEDTALAIAAGKTALDAINTRASLLDAVESAKDASLDYYLFTQSAYHQLRQNHIYDGDPPEKDEFDEEFDEEEWDEEEEEAEQSVEPPSKDVYGDSPVSNP